MTRAAVVIGAAFGDEGKGLMTDYHCRQLGDEPMVVRFNGGAQAGHTVVTPDGDRHVFHHFGAGTLAGARTFLSRYFLINPVVWRTEWEALQGRGLRLRLFVDREAPLTTVYDMLDNQALEMQRGERRHGSCGMGVHQTMVRQRFPQHRLFAGDLERPAFLRERLGRIREFHPEVYSAEMFERFLADCALMRQHINLTDSRLLASQHGIVFEGAQGLLLDERETRFFPHVTHSRTGLTNVIKLATEAGIDRLDVSYVVRSYLTRHGAGRLPGHDESLCFADDTNGPNEWQGALRFAPMDYVLVHDAIQRDLGRATADVVISPHLAITHLDQHPIWNDGFSWPAKYLAYGPTWKAVERTAL